MKYSVAVILFLFSLSSQASLQCREALSSQSLGDTGTPVNLFERGIPFSSELKADLKALSTEILKEYFSSQRLFDPLSHEYALEEIFKVLFSDMSMRFQVKIAVDKGVAIPLGVSGNDEVIGRNMEINLKSSLEEVVILLTKHRQAVQGFIRSEIFNIMSDVKNNVETGLFNNLNGYR